MKKIVLLIFVCMVVILMTGCKKKSEDCCTCKDCPDCDVCCSCNHPYLNK